MPNKIMEWLKELGDEPTLPKAPPTPFYASHVPIMPPNPPPGEGRDYRVSDEMMKPTTKENIFNVGVGPFPKRYDWKKKQAKLARK